MNVFSLCILGSCRTAKYGLSEALLCSLFAPHALSFLCGPTSSSAGDRGAAELLHATAAGSAAVTQACIGFPATYEVERWALKACVCTRAAEGVPAGVGGHRELDRPDGARAAAAAVASAQAAAGNLPLLLRAAAGGPAASAPVLPARPCVPPPGHPPRRQKGQFVRR